MGCCKGPVIRKISFPRHGVNITVRYVVVTHVFGTSIRNVKCLIKKKKKPEHSVQYRWVVDWYVMRQTSSISGFCCPLKCLIIFKVEIRPRAYAYVLVLKHWYLLLKLHRHIILNFTHPRRSWGCLYGSYNVWSLVTVSLCQLFIRLTRYPFNWPKIRFSMMTSDMAKNTHCWHLVWVNHRITIGTPHKEGLMRGFHVFFNVVLDKLLNKQPRLFCWRIYVNMSGHGSWRGLQRLLYTFLILFKYTVNHFFYCTWGNPIMWTGRLETRLKLCNKCVSVYFADTLDGCVGVKKRVRNHIYHVTSPHLSLR